MIRVLVSGAAGRMGREVLDAVTAADGMEVAGAVDPAAAGTELPVGASASIICGSDLGDAIDAAQPDVVVDFTRPDVVAANIQVALSRGVDCVVGTTGLSEEALGQLAQQAPPGVCLFVAPNFAVGAVLAMRFASQAAAFMPHAEIIELHHDRKADAPSGTAVRTARMIAEARGDAPRTPGRDTEIAEGARGAVIDGVHVHSVRLPGLVAHQEVLLGGQGQTLAIRHDSTDRTSFMPGVVLAIREVGSREGLIIGLEHLMGE